MSGCKTLWDRLASRLNSLKRQARQAKRYNELSSLIQQNEAIAFYLNWLSTGKAINDAEHALQEILRELGTQTQVEAAALTQQSDTTDALQPLRDEEATRAAVLHRLKVEQEALDKEEAASQRRQEELTSQLSTLESDLSREQNLISEVRKLLKASG